MFLGLLLWSDIFTLPAVPVFNYCSSLEVSSITHCTACFAFKSVKQCFLIPTTLILLINILQTIDIYHISFPNDARGIKLLGVQTLYFWDKFFHSSSFWHIDPGDLTSLPWGGGYLLLVWSRLR